jgi:cell division protein FtsI/penicillin-binding protein 2
MRYKLHTKRIKLLLGGFFCIALVLIVKLYMVQIVHGEQLSLKAERQYVRPYATIFDRGSIFFSEKTGAQISAGTLKSGYTLAINPSAISDSMKMY